MNLCKLFLIWLWIWDFTWVERKGLKSDFSFGLDFCLALFTKETLSYLVCRPETPSRWMLLALSVSKETTRLVMLSFLSLMMATSWLFMTLAHIPCPCIASKNHWVNITVITFHYSRFNSIRASPVYGVKRDENGDIKFICFKKRETVEECLQFWGLEEGEAVN